MADGELSTKIATLPSNILAAVTSGRSENLNFGNGLYHLCYFIWSFTVSEVTEEVFSLGLKQVLNINTPMFQNDTENLSSTQIEMLKAIADGEQHFSSQAVKQVYNLGNPNTIVKNKKILQNKDIIEKQKADFVFVDPIYRLWFKEEYC